MGTEEERAIDRIRALVSNKLRAGQPLKAADPQLVMQYDEETELWSAMLVSHQAEGKTEVEALRALESRLRMGEP